MVFFPRTVSFPKKLPDNIKPLKFRITKDITIGGMCYLKEEGLPTILMFHGNGEVSTDYLNLYQAYHEIGVNLAVADFRGYGFSTGRPVYSGLIKDAMPIYSQFSKWMDENGLRNSLFVKGRSLGSTCAAEIGSHNPENVRGMIFESGFASIYNMMTRLFRVKGPDITKEKLNEYSNDTRIRKFEKPTLVIHGTADWIVPVEEGKAIFKAIPKEVEKELVLIEGVVHNNIFSFKTQFFTALKEFIQEFQ